MNDVRIGDALLDKSCIRGVRRRLVSGSWITDLAIDILIVSDESIPGWVEVERTTYEWGTSWTRDPFGLPETEAKRQAHLKELEARNSATRLKALTRYRKIAKGLGFDPSTNDIEE